MINPYTLRRILAIIISCFVPLLAWVLTIDRYGLLYALVFVIVSIILSVVVSSSVLRNPFTDMLEGKGILTFDLNSTGILRPLITSINPPEMTTHVGNQAKKSVWSRLLTFNMKTPQKGVATAQERVVEDKNTGKKSKLLRIEVDEDKYNDSRFMLSYPVLLYNSATGSYITKTQLSDLESQSFADHAIIHLLRIAQQTQADVNDFNRGVVDAATKPGGAPWYQSKLLYWLIGIMFFILIGYFVIKSGAFSTIGGTISGAAGNIADTSGGVINKLG